MSKKEIPDPKNFLKKPRRVRCMTALIEHQKNELMELAIAVLKDKKRAEKWLASPAKSLGGAIPIEHATTPKGLEDVRNLLGRIEYGVYS